MASLLDPITRRLPSLVINLSEADVPVLRIPFGEKTKTPESASFEPPMTRHKPTIGDCGFSFRNEVYVTPHNAVATMNDMNIHLTFVCGLGLLTPFAGCDISSTGDTVATICAPHEPQNFA